MDTERSNRRESSRRGKLVEEELTARIIGAFFEVYNALGFGFRESNYKRVLEIASRRRGLLAEREFPVEIFFGAEQVGFHRIDLLVERRVIVEVKTTEPDYPQGLNGTASPRDQRVLRAQDLSRPRHPGALTSQAALQRPEHQQQVGRQRLAFFRWRRVHQTVPDLSPQSFKNTGTRLRN